MQGYQAASSHRPLTSVLKQFVEKETFSLKPMTGDKIKLFDNVDTSNAIQIPQLSF
jgi:hypothetical protein